MAQITLNSTGVASSGALVLQSNGTTTAITINSSQGVEFNAGTAALPAITTTGDTNTGIFFSAADTIDFAEGGTAVGQFDSSGNFKFNSGFGSVATAYACRAWVNFNGTGNTNLTGTYSQSGTTVTVTATAHGLIVGSSINADITSGTGVDGIYTVTAITDANTFTYTAGTSLTTSGNITLLRNTIRASGNVSSITDNGVGDYTVNFTTAMSDANYSVVCTTSLESGQGSARMMSINLNTAMSTTAVRTLVSNDSGTPEDKSVNCVSIFR